MCKAVEGVGGRSRVHRSHFARYSVILIPSTLSLIALVLVDMKLEPLGLTNPDPCEKERNSDHRTIDLGNGSEVVYLERFVPSDQSSEWFDYLDKEIPWTRPSIHVYGRRCLQPRDTCYVANKGLPEYKYSGYQPHAYSWDDYPLLKVILEAVHDALPGSEFNSLLLNRYKNGSDYVSWHSDDEELYGPTPEIASVSLGCERKFLLKKKPNRSSKVQVPGTASCTEESISKGSEKGRQSIMLKPGSLLVMRGYTQRDWFHSVPKRQGKAESVRINLTFRYVPVEMRVKSQLKRKRETSVDAYDTAKKKRRETAVEAYDTAKKKNEKRNICRSL